MKIDDFGASGMVKQVFEQIEKLNDKYVDVWEDILNIESPSDYKEGVDAVGEYLKKIAEDKNWKIEVFTQERFGDVICITMNSDSDNQPIAISGHMDTVHPVGSFGNPAARRDGNKLYGPGAYDCKGGIAAGFLAMDALDKCGFKNRPVMMILQSNEEVGSGLENKATIDYIAEKAKDVIAFLNLEGHESYFEGKTTLIRKGHAVFNFKVNGISTTTDASAIKGANAIGEAAYKIIEIEKIKDHEGTTCSCVLIGGGTKINVVPSECSFKVSVRFSTQAQYEETVEKLQKITDTVYINGCSTEMNLTNLRPTMEPNEKNLWLHNRANEIFKKNGLSTLEIGKRNGGSDASDLTLRGIPCMDSIGAGGEEGHTINEYGKIDSLAESAKRIASIICEI